MRLYKGRILRSGVQRQVEARVESRDAIVWEIIASQRIARVKIQGSNALIVAHYPENWESRPHWLKKGNAVSIRHTGGVRGRIELVGHGATIPTPVAGGTALEPDAEPDGVISGLTLAAPTGGSYMKALVLKGSLRVDGTVYADFVDSTTGYAADMGYTEASLCSIETIGTAHASNPRYDLIVVGTDRVVDVVAGTAAATPTLPATPADHFSLGHVLVQPGTTRITPADINATWLPRRLTTITVSASDEDLAWAQTTSTLTIAGQDQYGSSFSLTGYTINATLVSGNGTMSGSGTSWTYTRGGNDPGDISPQIKFTVSNYAAMAFQFIILRDAGGNIMI